MTDLAQSESSHARKILSDDRLVRCRCRSNALWVAASVVKIAAPRSENLPRASFARVARLADASFQPDGSGANDQPDESLPGCPTEALNRTAPTRPLRCSPARRAGCEAIAATVLDLQAYRASFQQQGPARRLRHRQRAKGTPAPLRSCRRSRRDATVMTAGVCVVEGWRRSSDRTLPSRHGSFRHSRQCRDVPAFLPRRVDSARSESRARPRADGPLA